MTREELIQYPEYWRTLYENECERLGIKPILKFIKPLDEDEVAMKANKYAMDNDNHLEWSEYDREESEHIPCDDIEYIQDAFEAGYREAFVNPINEEPYEPQPTYEMVDLGLPSGLKWAAYNIGATKPEEYGDYFMWGSVTPNNEDECDWAHTPFNNGASWYNEAYFNTHKSEWLNNDVLKPEYDAATVLWGAGYRMPTEADFNELLANTTNKWTKENGVKGKKFTSKTNGNSIFIPASGSRNGSSLIYQGRCGDLWSSSFNSDYPIFSRLLSVGSGLYCMNSQTRDNGFCVRPVSK